MIEVIYKDEKQEAKGNEGVFSVPKNIRQIGMIGEDYRIYIEDYVYTFLKKAAGTDRSSEEQKNCLAVLTGESKWASGVTYVFIKGALTVENTEVSLEHIDFSGEIWQKIQEETEKYFGGQEITGWFFSQKSLPLEATELFQKIHLKYFGGGEKILMLMDPAEREDALFRFENNFLVKQSGYYLYYEKNPQMQAYMLEKNPDFSGEEHEEIQDEAVKAFRKIIRKKKSEEQEETEEKTSVFSYAATACLVLAVAAVGMRFYQNYRDVQDINTKTETVSAILENQEEETETEEKKSSDEMKTEDFASKETTADQREDSADIPAETDETDDSQKEDDESVKENAADAKDESGKNQAGENESPSSTVSENLSGQEGISEEDAAIYREESDVRKAERRVQEAREDENGHSNDSQIKESDAAAADGNSYVIRPGDTLYQISMEKYGTVDEVTEICRLNDMSEDEIIYPGQIIVLP